MSKDNKSMLIHLGMLFLAMLLIYKIPHDSYSVIQYMIKPIREGGGVFYISSVIPLTLILLGIIGLVNLKRFANKNKILIFLLVVVIIMPIMKWSLDSTRTIYYWVKQDKLNAVDIEEPSISLSSNNEKLTITMKFQLINYSRGTNNLKFRVFLPEALRKYTGMNIYESVNNYIISGNRNKLNVEEAIVVDLENSATQNNKPDSTWFYEDIKYELYNDVEVVEIIHHGV